MLEFFLTILGEIVFAPLHLLIHGYAEEHGKRLRAKILQALAVQRQGSGLITDEINARSQ